METGSIPLTRCYNLPEKVEVTADLPPDARQRLTAVVLAAVGDAIRSAAPGETVAAQRIGRPAPRERFDPVRRDDGYATPSYDDGSGHRIQLPLSDNLLGIRILTQAEIEARVRRIIARPGPSAAQGRADVTHDPQRARKNLHSGHFRDDADRLSYAVGYFRGLIEIGGDNADRLEELVVAYEMWYQSQLVDVVLSSPPTPAQLGRLRELRRRRQGEADARQAEKVRQERERARKSPEDLSGFPDPAAGGPYSDQGITLPYPKLVPDPDPRKGFDEHEVRSVLKDPRRFEQLYFDATHGHGKAAWLVAQFEWKVRNDARQAAHDVADITTFRGLVHSLIGTGGHDFHRYGFSPATASGRRMFVVFAEAFADEANDVQLTNTVIGNLLNLWAAGKLTEAALASAATRVPIAPAPAAEPVRPTAPAGPSALPAGEPLAPPPGQPAPTAGPTASGSLTTSGSRRRQIGFRPAQDTEALAEGIVGAEPLSRPVAGLGRPIGPRPPGVAGPGRLDLPRAREVPGSGEAVDNPAVTSMSSGNRQRRGGGKQPPPLTEEEFATWERVRDDKPNPAPADTEHFGVRQGERGPLTASEHYREQQAIPRAQSANDAIVRVLKEGENDYTVIVRRRDDAGVTVIRNKSRQEVKGLSDRYGWNPRFE